MDNRYPYDKIFKALGLTPFRSPETAASDALYAAVETLAKTTMKHWDTPALEDFAQRLEDLIAEINVESGKRREESETVEAEAYRKQVRRDYYSGQMGR